MKKNRVGWTAPVVIGYDTETCDGPPITVQFYSEHIPRINGCLFVDKETVLTRVLKHLSTHCKVGEYVIYGHNLRFDLVSIFYDQYEKLTMKRGTFELTHGRYSISGVYGNPTFCVLETPTARITFVDSFSWFMSSLAKVAELICPDVPKLDMPEGLGTRVFTRKDKEFIAYAMTDAQVAYYAGVQIDNMHKEFELNQCVSVAQMASSIFTQHYISEHAPIWNTQPFMNKGAVASYHGGKNNVIPGAAPAHHEHVDAWDLSSAYPHAMCQMPAMSRPELFVGNRIFNKRARTFPDHSILCISGYAEACFWPIVSDEHFKYIRGPFEDLWVTGYELNEARRMGEVALSKVWGHYYDSDKDPVTETAFQAYVLDFYEMKQTATDPIYRYMYKVLLNSLYGKFIQSREVETAEGTVKWKHGPLYHPMLASLITGHTRAVMHRLEHEVEALHTATDGVFCGANKSPADGKFPWAPQGGLGAIESEGRDLNVDIMRNKLYVARDQDGNMVKFAKHGFQGTLDDLVKCIQEDVRSYSVNKPNTLKTSVNRGLVPNKFEERELSLNIGPMLGRFNHARKGSTT